MMYAFMNAKLIWCSSVVLEAVIWCVALWSPQPEPVRPSETEIEPDYGFLAGNTRVGLARMSSQIVRILKP